jgi:hypothetical protein
VPIIWILVLCASVGWVCMLVGFVMGCEWAARVRDQQGAKATLLSPVASDSAAARTIALVDRRLHNPASLN